MVQQEKNIEACAEAYPQLQEEIASGKPQTKRGLAALLRDHLIDLSLFIDLEEPESDPDSEYERVELETR